MSNFIEFDFENYMLDCAKRLKELQHSDTNQRFFGANSLTGMQDLLNNLPTAQYPAIVVLNSTKGRIGDENQSNNFIDHPFHTGFVITAPLQGITDAITIGLAKKEAKSILLKIIAKMKHDRRRALHGLNFLKMLSIPYQEVGPIGVGSYGVMFNIENAHPTTLTHNLDDWLPEV